MSRIRNTSANVLVGVAVTVAALWLFRSVFRVVSWGVKLILVVVVVGAILWLAGKVRG